MNPRDVVSQFGFSLVGKEYLWGGAGPYFDCSGLCIELLKCAGLKPPHDMSASQLFEHYKPTSEWGAIQWGSLLFFGQSTAAIKHVSFALNDLQMLEAGGGDASCKTIEASRARGAFTKVCWIGNRKDFVASLLPKYPFPV